MREINHVTLCATVTQPGAGSTAKVRSPKGRPGQEEVKHHPYPTNSKEVVFLCKPI